MAREMTLWVSRSTCAIGSTHVTYDFGRLMDGATEVKCSEFADGIIRHS